jgi:hypothetical protein
MNLIEILSLGIIITIAILWTIFIPYMFYISWKNIPLRKYKGRLPGQLCVVVVHIILLTLVWIQVFFGHIPNGIFFLFWGIAMLFFLLYLGFGVIERRDLDRKLKWLINKHKHNN